MFDPLKQRAVGPAPPLAERSDNSPEERAKEMEKEVNALIEASAEAARHGDTVQSLERAKEAVRRGHGVCLFVLCDACASPIPWVRRVRRNASCADTGNRMVWWIKSTWTSRTACASTLPTRTT